MPEENRREIISRLDRGVCPGCTGGFIDKVEEYSDGDEYYVLVRCETCGAKWQQVYCYTYSRYNGKRYESGDYELDYES